MSLEELKKQFIIDDDAPQPAKPTYTAEEVSKILRGIAHKITLASLWRLEEFGYDMTFRVSKTALVAEVEKMADDIFDRR